MLPKAEISGSVNHLEQRSEGMKTSSVAPTNHLISLPGHTKRYNPPPNLISVFTLSKSVPSICLCLREISPLLHCHATTQQSRLRGQGSLPEVRRQSHRAGEKRPYPLPPRGTANSNLHGRNPHPLVQTHLKVPRQCRLIDSACVEGLGVVYAECQASASQLSVSAQVAE